MIGRFARVPPLPAAIVLALASAPVVAGTILIGTSSFPFPSVASVIRPEDGLGAVHEGGPGIGGALSVSIAAVLAAALAGAWEGGLARRTGRTWAVLVAVAAAWAVGIAAVPLAAWLLHVPLRPGAGCSASCPGWLVDPAPWSGLVAYGRSVAYGVIAWPGVIVAAILAVAAHRNGRRLLTSLAVLGVYAAIHVWSVTQAALPFACLVGGVLVWDELLERRSARVG